jgi:hypothetical protein
MNSQLSDALTSLISVFKCDASHSDIRVLFLFSDVLFYVLE